MGSSSDRSDIRCHYVLNRAAGLSPQGSQMNLLILALVRPTSITSTSFFGDPRHRPGPDFRRPALRAADCVFRLIR